MSNVFAVLLFLGAVGLVCRVARSEDPTAAQIWALYEFAWDVLVAAFKLCRLAGRLAYGAVWVACWVLTWPLRATEARFAPHKRLS